MIRWMRHVQNLARQHGMLRVTRRARWLYQGGRWYYVVNLGAWWLTVNIERKGQLPV